MNKQVFFPWQSSQRRAVLKALEKQRLPHAMLLNGPGGMGKKQFAEDLLHTLLCYEADAEGRACGVCKACLLLRADTHPDIQRLSPEGAGGQIKIGQIRELIEWCALSPSFGSRKAALIAPAEAMNVNAANALLKLLEEPPEHTLLILLSAQAARLPATIRSRCQRLDFNTPAREEKHAWLEEALQNPALDLDLLLDLSDNAPLAAQTLAAAWPRRGALLDDVEALLRQRLDPVEGAQAWLKTGAAEVLKQLNAYLLDALKGRWSGAHMRNRDLAERVTGLLSQASRHKLLQLLEEHHAAYRLLLGGNNLKEQSILEGIALSWLELGVDIRRKAHGGI